MGYICLFPRRIPTKMDGSKQDTVFKEEQNEFIQIEYNAIAHGNANCKIKSKDYKDYKNVTTNETKWNDCFLIEDNSDCHIRSSNIEDDENFLHDYMKEGIKDEYGECEEFADNSEHILEHGEEDSIDLHLKGFKCDDCNYCNRAAKPQKPINEYIHSSYTPEVKTEEIHKFKCSMCDFRSKYSQNIRQHEVVHKNPSEIIMFQCEKCDFQSKYKRCMKRHTYVHKDLTKNIVKSNTNCVTWYKCSNCNYKSWQRGNFKRHMLLMHKDTTEVLMYKCDKCDYQSRYKSNWLRHSVVHASKGSNVTDGNSKKMS